MHSIGARTPWYPHLASDRADELIAELDARLQAQLYRALQATTFSGWIDWLTSEQAAIERYDAASARQRTALLRSPADEASLLESLRLQHACIFLELCRLRVAHLLPPRGLPVDRPPEQRALVLAAYASIERAEPSDYWPFEVPEGASAWPFAES